MQPGVARLTTPLGAVLCRLNEDAALAELKLVGDPRTIAGADRTDTRTAQVQQQLAEYFAGSRREFELPLAPSGTAFQLRVWDALRGIPYGRTTTYSALARRLGDPRTVRAVGRANAANPIWVIIPCHRVVGADGSLTGYAAGLEVKRYLLELEGAIAPGLFPAAR
jgi:methylated-DNA-[protein]-cysteine S-methyltransferase